MREILIPQSVFPAVAEGNKKIPEQEMKKAAQEFSAILYEKMLTQMVNTAVGEKKPYQELAWQQLIAEIAGITARSGNGLTESLLPQKNNQK